MLNILSIIRLWSIGVGSVIGGDFFGWNVILKGGFGTSLISFLLNSILYGILANTTSKLITKVNKGGSYQFVCYGINKKVGLLIACLELIKLFWVLSSLCFGLTDYFYSLFNFQNEIQFLFYPLLFILFSSLGMLGIKTSGNIQIFVTCGCILVLLFYWISVSTHFNFYKYAIPNNNWFNGWKSILTSIPYGSWLFLGFEELPLIQVEDVDSVSGLDNLGIDGVEHTIVSPPLTTMTSSSSSSLSSSKLIKFETHQEHHHPFHHTLIPHLGELSSNHITNQNSTTNTTPIISTASTTNTSIKSSIPSQSRKTLFHAILASFCTVFISGFLTVTLSSSSQPGVETLEDKSSPLMSGIEKVYGENSPVVILFNILSILALFAPCYSFMLYCSQHIQEIAEAKIIPSFFGRTNERGIPIVALWSVAFLGWILMSIFGLLFGLSDSTAIMIPGCIAPAFISYFFQIQALINIQAREAKEFQLNQSVESFERFFQTQNTIPTFQLYLGQLIIIFEFICILILSSSSQNLMIGMIIVTIATLGVLIWIGYIDNQNNNNKK